MSRVFSDLSSLLLGATAGADPSITAEDDVTALKLARAGNHLEVVRLLEEHQ